jgi:hypothetical protein
MATARAATTTRPSASPVEEILATGGHEPPVTRSGAHDWLPVPV